MKTNRSRFFGPFLLSLLLFASAFGQADEARITILHLNDTYQFTPVDGGKSGGLARVMKLRRQISAENPNTVLTLGGDTLSPSVETRIYRGEQMIDAWNTVGLDLAVFGNHEFDLKSDELLKRIKDSKFVWLGANVIDNRTGKTFANSPEFVIKEIGGVKIGFVGLLLPETKETSSVESFISITDYCDAAARIVPRVRAAGASVVIGLTHLFMYQDKRLTGCAKFDLILGGHEHTLLQSLANGTPIFKMTADAREIGRFDLYIDKKTGRLNSVDWRIIPVNETVPEDPAFAPVALKYKDLIEKLGERVGATSVILDALSLHVRTKETNIGDFIADAYRKAVDADVAIVNGGSIRADLTYNPGPLTKRDVLSILPFNNPIVKIRISGKTLLQALEHGVARSSEDNEPGRFPQVSGIRFVFDASRPPGNRIVEASVNGRPIDRDAKYTLATSDFLVSKGGDGYTMFKDAEILISAKDAPKDSDVLEKAIRHAPNSTIAPVTDGRIERLN
ncbi:MAG: bifunctional metallophosphatase/5'-nucleotidase [Blastocatellia bacterium]